MTVGKVGVARRCAAPPVPELFADEWQVPARHDGMAGRGVPEAMEAQPAERGIGADRAPEGDEAGLAAAMGSATTSPTRLPGPAHYRYCAAGTMSTDSPLC